MGLDITNPLQTPQAKMEIGQAENSLISFPKFEVEPFHPIL
jgi:hypothetical protein